MNIQFLGAAEGVTGSKFLVETGGTKVLIDCGLFQEREFQARNWDPFPVDPKTIDVLLLTHAHIDHCGYIPKLVKEGFNGPIYCTGPTLEIVKISLLDAAKLQESDAAYKLKRHKREGRKGPHPVKPLYTVDDAKESFPLFKKISYKEEFKVKNIGVTYHVAGHILGAAMIELKVNEEGKDKTVVFSGDIGRWDRPIIQDPHIFESADYVVMEATYGDRLHEKQDDSLEELAAIVKDTQKRGGNVLIPTFAIERAQELLFYFNQLLNEKRIPQIMTFLDSPMAIKVTKVFNEFSQHFDAEAKEMLKTDESLFNFPLLKSTVTTDQSRAINYIKGTSIVLAGSGMCTGGRIKHHLVQNISREASTILFVGYQAHGTLGRIILEGNKEVRIFGQIWKVKAKIEKINGFSAHADQNELLTWIKGFKQSPKKVFIVHSEKNVAHKFAEQLKSELNLDAKVPQYLEKVEI